MSGQGGQQEGDPSVAEHASQAPRAALGSVLHGVRLVDAHRERKYCENPNEAGKTLSSRASLKTSAWLRSRLFGYEHV